MFREVPPWAWGWALALGSVFLVLGLVVSWLGFGHSDNALDHSVTEWAHAHAWLRGVWAVRVTKLGDSGWVWKLGAGTVVVLALTRRWQHASGLLMAVAGKDWLIGFLQNFYERVRPWYPDVEGIMSYGYPSGHTSGAAVIFGFWILVALKECRDWRVRAAVIAAAALGLSGVGLTRVTLIVHWATDVIGGVGFGGSWVIFCFFANLGLVRWACDSGDGVGRPGVQVSG